MDRCDSVHMRYVDRGVINYAKALVRVIERGRISEVWPATVRLIAAVRRLADEDRREREREVSRGS